MSFYDNGYRPTMNLRIYKQTYHQTTGKLQQQWVSDFVGFEPIWRDVPDYFSAIANV